MSVEEDIDWGTGSSPRRSGVTKRRPSPVSENTKAFRETLPDIPEMQIGDRVFVPTLDQREELVISAELKKVNARISDRHWFGLLEWRSHVRGRLIICVSQEEEPDWRELWRRMYRSIQVNKRTPPLDPMGNALVPEKPL